MNGIETRCEWCHLIDSDPLMRVASARSVNKNQIILSPQQPLRRIHTRSKQRRAAHYTALDLNAAHKKDALPNSEHHLLYPCVCPHLLGKGVER